MNKKQVLTIGLTALLVFGGISAYTYQAAFTAALDYTRNGDADRDGMPTRFEQKHGLDPLRDDRFEDLDADGKFNVDEYHEGLSPSNPDSDGDRLADGIDRAPTDARGLAMSTQFDPGLLWARIPLDLTRLECQSRAATRIPLVHTFELGGWKDRGCIESPDAVGAHATSLHPVADTPWRYLDVDPEGPQIGPITEPRVYKDEDGLVHYEIKYTAIRERFFANVANTELTELRDSDGQPYQYKTFNIVVPANPAQFVTVELQGYAGHDLPIGFDVRFYSSNDYQPNIYESRSVVMAYRSDGGAFQADIPLPSTLAPGSHVLFLMPFLIDPNLERVMAPTDFAIYNVNQRVLEGVIFNATVSHSPLLDGVPPGAEGVEAATPEDLAKYVAAAELDLANLSKVATLVESFAVIGVIPDAKVGLSTSLGGFESKRLAGAKGIVVTHEQGGKYHVATRSASLLNNEQGLRLVTRTTTESFTKLPPRYAEYAGKGLVESSAHAVAVAAEIGASAQAVVHRAEADTAHAGIEKLRAGFGGTRTALDEVDPKGGFAKTALRSTGVAVLVLDVVAMNRYWEQISQSTNPIDTARAWGLLIATGVSAATIVLPFSPFSAAVAAIVAIAAQFLLDSAFYEQALDKTLGAVKAVSGQIPDSDQRAIFARAVADFAPIARAANAPLFVGQFDDHGNAVTPAVFLLPQGKVGMTAQLVVFGFLSLLVLVALSRRG